MRLWKLLIFFLLLYVLACSKSSPTDSKEEPINNSDEYGENIVVSTPKPFELFNIAISLTDYGVQNNNYVNQSSQYYKDVQSFFSSNKSHAFVSLINEFGKQDGGSEDDIIANYNNIKKASLYFQIQEDSLTVDENLFNFVPDSMVYIIQQILLNANLFIKESGFFQFYQAHLDTYQDIADKFKAAVPSQTVWDWLETKFTSIQYQYYQIPLSPLTGGSHCTELDKVSLNSIYMIVSSPAKYLNNNVEEGNYTLFLFTEIDHNYVNPISDIYLDEINSAFADINKWNNASAYRSPYDTFNEYMTWAIFTLFAYDRYTEKAFQEINKATVENMISNRKFLKFNEFNEELLKLYKNEESYTSIEELFTPILNWAKDQ
ncbi:MAG: DUF4932 domain-containing protein [Calditrichaceae bacterium]